MPWKKLLAWAIGQIDEGLRQKLEFVLSRFFVRRAVRMMSVRVYHFTPPCPLSLYIRLFTANIALRHTPLGFGSFF